MTNLAIGLVAGILSGLFGIGGGVVIVPSLIFFSRMKTQTAIGTSLAALLLPVGALGAWHYYRNHEVEPRAALILAVGLLLGAWLGARAGVALPPRVLQRAFAVFLVLIAVQLWWKS
jgi:uncharacterized membrane protein YfcA